MTISTQELEHATEGLDGLIELVKGNDVQSVTVENLTLILINPAHLDPKNHRDLVCLIAAIAIKRLANS